MLKYLFIINLISLIIYGLDKLLSIKHWYRVSEFILLSFGLVGGVIGSLFGMHLFRHKTKKIKFRIYLFIYSILWLLVIYLYYNGYLFIR